MNTDLIQADDKTILEISALSPVALHYLAQYGLNKSLQDAVAGMAKVLGDLHVRATTTGLVTTEGEVDETAVNLMDKARKDIGREEGPLPPKEDFVKAVIAARRAVRLEAIMAGTVSTGSAGPRVQGVDKVMKDIAIERLRNAFGQVKKSMPTGQALTDLVGKMLAKYGEEIRVEADHRMAQALDSAGILEDLDL